MLKRTALVFLRGVKHVFLKDIILMTNNIYCYLYILVPQWIGYNNF